MPKPDTKIMPNPILEKRGRRVFTTEYKLSIIQQAAATNKDGKIYEYENGSLKRVY